MHPKKSPISEFTCKNGGFDLTNDEVHDDDAKRISEEQLPYFFSKGNLQCFELVPMSELKRIIPHSVLKITEISKKLQQRIFVYFLASKFKYFNKFRIKFRYLKKIYKIIFVQKIQIFENSQNFIFGAKIQIFEKKYKYYFCAN